MSSKKELDYELKEWVNDWDEVSDTQVELLSIKQQFYKELIPYIQIEKLESFKKYVDSDLTYNEKSKDIQVQINQKNIERNERVEELREQINDNSREFRKQIEESITIQVKWKLDVFIVQESFSKLENETKIKIFSNIILKFEVAIGNLENSLNPTRALEERIIWLKVVVEILESYIKNWN
jgi:hypothetical protein